MMHRVKHITYCTRYDDQSRLGDQAPKRHCEPDKPITPSKLHVPIELLEKISSECDKNAKASTVRNLRLVCRSFADGLLSTLAELKELVVYLDNQGVRDFERVASDPKRSIMARNIRVGMRKIAHHPIVLRVKESTRQANAAEMAINFIEQTKSKGEDFFRSLKDGADFYGLRFSIGDEGEPQGCQLLPENHNYTPTTEVLTRFGEHLRRLPLLRSLESHDEVKHVVIIIKDAKGFEIRRYLVRFTTRKTRYRSFINNDVCRCICNQEDVDYVVCKNVRSLSRAFFFDFARLPCLANFTVDHLSTVKVISIDVPNAANSIRLATSSEVSGVAMMLLGCTSLQKLKLWTTIPDRSTSAGNIIASILRELNVAR